MAMVQLFLRILWLSFVSIIPPLLRTNLHMLLLPGQMGDAWEPSKKQCYFGNRVSLGGRTSGVTSSLNV
jgi:hypothetical protein